MNEENRLVSIFASSSTLCKYSQYFQCFYPCRYILFIVYISSLGYYYDYCWPVEVQLGAFLSSVAGSVASGWGTLTWALTIVYILCFCSFF